MLARKVRTARELVDLLTWLRANERKVYSFEAKANGRGWIVIADSQGWQRPFPQPPTNATRK
jgi:hypothetical protein